MDERRAENCAVEGNCVEDAAVREVIKFLRKFEFDLRESGESGLLAEVFHNSGCTFEGNQQILNT